MLTDLLAGAWWPAIVLLIVGLLKIVRPALHAWIDRELSRDR
jgi:hypothetical protein